MSFEAYLFAWFNAFLVTQAVEAPIYRYGYRVSWLLALAPSAITHPLLWIAYYQGFNHLIPLSQGGQLFTIEALVCLLEGLFLLGVVGRKSALIWAVIANGASVLVGITLRALIGWP